MPGDRVADRLAGALLPLALAAVALALLVPSQEIATRGDLLLAALVVLTALGIAPHELWDLRTRWQAVLALSLAPFLVLVPLAWVLSRLFASPVREGVLTLGLSSTEVAAVGLVALAGGDAALALGALAGSLIASATLGPLLIGLLAADAASTDTGALLGRFALVVLIPLAAGVAARSAAPRVPRGEPWYAAGSTVAVAALIYAALSDTSAGDHLAPALAASTAFLAVSALLALAAACVVSPSQRSAVGLAAALRDFAVAATLATQAFGPSAATVAGIYGVLMLITGALTATTLRGSAPRTQTRGEPADDHA
jgi:bile acid:Na+ symporter, BASS family